MIEAMKSAGVRTLLAVGLAAVLLYFALRGVEWSRVGATIAGARWQYLLYGTAVSIVAMWLRAMRWRVLLNAEHGPLGKVSPSTVFWSVSAGYLGNLVLPARAGELVRSFLISSKSGLSKTYVLTTALGERVIDAIALILFSSIAMMTVEAKPDWMDKMARSLAAVAVLAALSVAILPYVHGIIEKVLHKLPMPHGLRDKVIALIEQVMLGLRAFHDVGRFGLFVGLTIPIWCGDMVGAWLTAKALDLSVTLVVSLLLISALGLGSALPSTPGYVGIFQFVGVTVLGPFGIGKDQAIAYVLVMQAISSVVFLIFGAVGIVKMGGSLTDMRALAKDEKT